MASTEATAGAIGVPSPRDMLPHGEAFRFVDRILSHENGIIRAMRIVPLQEPWTAAHFPGNPIVPGVLILEGMTQTAGLLARWRDSDDGRRRGGVLAAVRSARFLAPVEPGSTIVYEARLLGRVGALYAFEARALLGSVLVAQAELSLALSPEPAGDAGAQGAPAAGR